MTLCSDPSCRVKATASCCDCGKAFCPQHLTAQKPTKTQFRHNSARQGTKRICKGCARKEQK